jgi:hypothetical protein
MRTVTRLEFAKFPVKFPVSRESCCQPARAGMTTTYCLLPLPAGRCPRADETYLSGASQSSPDLRPRRQPIRPARICLAQSRCARSQQERHLARQMVVATARRVVTDVIRRWFACRLPGEGPRPSSQRSWLPDLTRLAVVDRPPVCRDRHEDQPRRDAV